MSQRDPGNSQTQHNSQDKNPHATAICRCTHASPPELTQPYYSIRFNHVIFYVRGKEICSNSPECDQLLVHPLASQTSAQMTNPPPMAAPTKIVERKEGGAVTLFTA